MECQTLFSWGKKNKKVFQNVIYRNFYKACQLSISIMLMSGLSSVLLSDSFKFDSLMEKDLVLPTSTENMYQLKYFCNILFLLYNANVQMY